MDDLATQQPPKPQTLSKLIPGVGVPKTGIHEHNGVSGHAETQQLKRKVRARRSFGGEEDKHCWPARAGGQLNHSNEDPLQEFSCPPGASSTVASTAAAPSWSEMEVVKAPMWPSPLSACLCVNVCACVDTCLCMCVPTRLNPHPK